VVGAVLSSAAGAQVRDTARTKRDTLRGRADTITAKPDTGAKRDTTRDVRVQVPAGPDSLLHRDSLARRDTIRAHQPPRDTIKAPLVNAEAPVLADPSGSFVWDRRDLYSTGALTVADLLERVPGVTTLRSGWISQPIVGSFLGDPGRVRVFLDGLELEEMDPRMGRAWDLTQIPIWALDDVRVERGASEVRIYMRSWRVDRTTPYTRTDVYTGDQATNLYRGYFGRRYTHGELLQAAAQQYGTDPGRNAASSDQLGVLLRTGVARKRWSADVMLLRNDRNRGITVTSPLSDTIPAVESTRSDLYARVGWGRSDSSFWAQAIADGTKYTYGGKQAPGLTNTSIADTTRFRAQYVLSAGYAAGPLRASVTQRFRTGLFQRVATPSARIGVDTKWVSASLLAEGRGLDSTRRADASVVLRPLSFVFVAGALGSEQALFPSDSTSVAQFARGEVGVRVGRTWLTGGVLRRDPTALNALRMFRSATIDTTSESVQGVFATVRGRVWKSVYADAQAVQWSDTGSLYRPKYQTRTELYVSTSLLDKFPTGNFHLLASAVHEYRSSMLWPESSGVVRVKGYRTISTLLQVRILTAEVFWTFRNVMRERYSQIPGYPLPRGTNIYGVRWEFWN
jgi:hypothetical protein